MADTSSNIVESYPIPSYRFIVTVGTDTMAFSAVSGLQMGFDTIEYKDGAGNAFKMPGQRQSLNVSLRRGLVKGKSQLSDWLNSIAFNRVDKKDISISLTDDTGSTLFVTWNVANAFPTSMSAPNFDATSNEVAVEELSLMADSVSVQFH